REPRVKPTHEAADAFWRYWHENGETHKHGYYESTWGAINAALACGWTESAPQPQPVLSGYGDYGAAIPEIERPCTCHPDDNPPVPCARKYALNECRAASEPTEAQRELTPAESDVLDSALRKSVKVVARGLREPTEAQQLSAAPPHEFTQWIRDNMPPNTIIGDPEWWAPRLWQRAIRALAAKE
ncbi:MAG: hypothetical protein J5J04_10775, partial [Anaerolineae bacterium]|nr:hypothetical protein [Anaerolineae bacterium]